MSTYAAWRVLISRPAFFLVGVIFAVILLNMASSWLEREATSSVSASRQTRRVRSAPSVEIKPPIVKAPALKPKVAAQIEKDYGFGKGSVTTAGDIALGQLKEKTVLDEAETAGPIPEGAEVKSISTLGKDGETTTTISTELPLFSLNQRVGFGLGFQVSGVPAPVADAAGLADGLNGYFLWEPLHFPKWRSHVRLTVDPGHFNDPDLIQYKIHWEYRGD